MHCSETGGAPHLEELLAATARLKPPPRQCNNWIPLGLCENLLRSPSYQHDACLHDRRQVYTLIRPGPCWFYSLCTAKCWNYILGPFYGLCATMVQFLELCPYIYGASTVKIFRHFHCKIRRFLTPIFSRKPDFTI